MSSVHRVSAFVLLARMATLRSVSSLLLPCDLFIDDEIRTVCEAGRRATVWRMWSDGRWSRLSCHRGCRQRRLHQEFLQDPYVRPPPILILTDIIDGR